MIESLQTLPAAAQAQLPRGGVAPASLQSSSANDLPLRMTGRSGGPQAKPGEEKLRETFDQFVGETFYGSMLKSMRSTQGKPAYMHGGRAEEVFQGQLDQMMVTEMASSSGNDLSGDMFELFQLNRR